MHMLEHTNRVAVAKPKHPKQSDNDEETANLWSETGTTQPGPQSRATVAEELEVFPGCRAPLTTAPLALTVLKVLLGTVLVPLRIVLFVCVTTLFWLSVKVLVIGHKKDGALRGWRWACIDAVARTTSRALLLCCGYHWIHRSGRPADRETPTSHLPTLVSNHQSWTDPFAIMAMGHGCYGFLAMAELRKAPVLGVAARAVDGVFVDRTSEASRAAAAEALKRRMQDTSQSRVVVFPEAGTSDGSCLLQFRKGAFRPGLPLQPCLIRYPHRWYNQSWDSQSIWSHVFNILSSPHNRVSITFMPVYHPSPAEQADPALYADNLRKSMCEEWRRVYGCDIRESSLSMTEKRIYQKYRDGVYDWGECLRRLETQQVERGGK
ncbi:hypothetical protein KIPB_000998 [Kipferlia bialata]|uniref:Phospholipid/glycerol acyltransferase domain-containing protein n=1 Tax=Kipferlia bialata TaxID=797122 RepID=A0A9K3GF73_9EUKA|nr:hypothetical protein KIPB_000998 [Kipferlia bialata]|eukprot:g998.t1